MTIAHVTSTIKHLDEHLFNGLTSADREKAIRNTPFSMIDGALGDAYTASCLHYATGDQKWWDLLVKRIGHLVEVLKTHRFDQEGLLGGLSGVAYLLQVSRRNEDEFSNALTSLSARITALTERRLWDLHSSVGTRREDYDYAVGITGTAHFLFSVGGPGLQLADRICHQFADLAGRALPESFWTCAADLETGMLEQNPEMSSGMRDLGFAHGIAGVIAVLRTGYQVFDNSHYLDAAIQLCEVLVEDIAVHSNHGPSYFQTPPVSEEKASPSIKARQAWCYGAPSAELAVAGCKPLEQKLYQVLTYGEDYFDPQLGFFDDTGLCHGVAGRQYLADRLNLPTSQSWSEHITAQVEGFLAHPYTDADLSFWHGLGGTIAVWSGLHDKRGHAPALSILGVRP